MARFIPLFFIASLWFNPCWGLELPTGMDKPDLTEVMTTVGLGSSTKLVSNPFPLGGFSGFEVGLSAETIGTDGISRLGNISASDRQKILQKELVYPRLTIGKGLYENTDLFVHFVPYSDNNEVNEYGGLVRWNFYQAKFLPIAMSLLVHGSHLNLGDAYTSQSIGTDLLFGINVDNLALYFGGGQLKVSGVFKAEYVDLAAVGLSPSEDLVDRIHRAVHSFAGISYRIEHYFVALQMDRYKDPVYSAKVGIRY